jgi:hypothetical protein
MFNKKKKYFEQKLEAVQKMIWDLEFKRFKSLEIREEVRMQYDSLKAKVQMVKDRIKTFPELDPELVKLEYSDIKLIDEKKKKWSDEENKLDDEKILMERDIQRYEGQMKQIDMDVHGANASVDRPDGVQGLDHQLESLQELKGMLKIYNKTL